MASKGNVLIFRECNLKYFGLGYLDSKWCLLFQSHLKNINASHFFPSFLQCLGQKETKRQPNHPRSSDQNISKPLWRSMRYWLVNMDPYNGLWHDPSAQIIIFHQPRFPWNKGISLTKPPFGVRSCEVAIIWPDPYAQNYYVTGPYKNYISKGPWSYRPT